MAVKNNELKMSLANRKNMPVMSFDPVDRMLRNIQRYDPAFSMRDLECAFDYPLMSEYELIKVYLYGGGRPFVDFLVYMALGVGWTYEAKDFDDEEKGRDAVKEATEFTKKVKLEKTMNRFGTFYEVLGRACLIKTRNLLGEFISDENAGITGIDCINPMTLTDSSLSDAMKDTKGTVVFTQMHENGETSDFTQDRVLYRTQNNLSGDKSYLGVSRLQSCAKEFRTLSKFPEYRSKLGRLYSEITQVITVNTEKMEGPMKDKMMESNKEAQKFLDETAEYYRRLATQGSIAAAFDWFEIVNSTFAGQEVKIDAVEDKTLSSIGRNMGVPVPLIDSGVADIMNRNTLEAIRDTNIAMEEKGTRKLIYKPIIEGVVNEHLKSQGITNGRVECKFNPFLSDNLLQAAQIISLIWQTNAISRPEVRKRIGEPPEIDTGGKEWEKLDIDAMPSIEKPPESIPSLHNNANNGPQPDGNQNPNKPPESAEINGKRSVAVTQKVKGLKKMLIEEGQIEVFNDG
jgi:hypothetical protein